MDNLHLIQLNQYERPAITEERNRDWVGIGDDNDYYQNLISAYMDSTTNQAVINGIVNMIYGKGLDATDSNEKPEEFAQMKQLLTPTCMRKVCNDLKLLGEAAIQVSYKGNKIGSLTHFPRETLRAEKMDANGDIKNYYYAPDWTKVTRNTKLTKFPVFGSGAKNEIYIIKRFVSGYYYYSPADYQISYAVLEKEIADFLINDAHCSFSGTKVINFNGGIPDRTKQLEIKDQVMGKLTGSYGEKVIVAFNNSVEQKCTIDDVPLADAANHYQYLSEECASKIMVTHRVTSPLLIGLREGKNGLGNNADEIKTAALLFDNVVIKPYQELIIDSLNELLAVNDISLNLYFKTLQPLEFTEIDETVQDSETIEEETGIKQDEQEQAQLEMSTHKHCLSDLPDEFYDDILEGLEGEVMDGDEYEMVDVRTVDENNSDVEEWAGNLLELAKVVERSTPLPNKLNRYSVLDKSFYKVRYRYAEVKSSSNSRKFCKEMMKRSRAGVVYRIEDIDAASKNWSASKYSSLELPMHKDKPFDLFKFKGGVYCGHIFQEVLYKVKNKDKKDSKRLKDYDEVSSIPKSYQPTPRGHKVAKVAPTNMPNNGHHPNYKK